MTSERKDPVTRLLEYLRFRTISGEGPRGSYAQVTMALCCCQYFTWMLLCDNVLCVVTSAPSGSARTLKRVSALS